MRHPKSPAKTPVGIPVSHRILTAYKKGSGMLVNVEVAGDTPRNRDTPCDGTRR